MNQVEALEAAILARAERLAAEYRERAERSRARILKEATDQLRLREQREVMLAKSQAERGFRRRVQSNELKLHAHMDHLRWNLVRGVEQRLDERLRAFVEQEDAYFRVLQGLLAEGARLIEQERLTATLNRRDHQRLAPRWAAFAAAATAKAVALADTPMESLGGILVQSQDGRIRLDNSFEGRRERLRPRLHQVIVERLLPVTADGGARG